jgi:ParB family chromosome partitioning protein
MSEPQSEVRLIPIKDIKVLNPRARSKKVFNELVTSIAHLGLKRPITVTKNHDTSGFDLVCGQGRLEAFAALGQTEIPSIVVETSVGDCFVMSLVENIARRNHSSLELLREIGALRERGYTQNLIAAKTDFSEEYVSAICYLLDHGEERLLEGVDKGTIPPAIAIEISRAQDADVQKGLAEAYEQKRIPGNQVIAIRRIVEKRNLIGKTIQGKVSQSRGGKGLSASKLLRAYQRETQRQRLLVKKATLAQSRLLFIVNGLRRLLADPNFVSLLRAENIGTLPSPLAERLASGRLS